MDLTAGNLVKVLAACCGGVPDGRAEATMLVRRAQPSFAATLYSAWQAEDGDLNPGLRYDLDAARQRIGFYRSLAAHVASHVPGITSIKGLEVADLYPAGLVRSMNDLDLIALAERDLWSAVTLLVGDGWTVETGTFSHFGGALRVMISLRHSVDDPYQLPYGVEIATYYTLGNLGGIGPILQLPRPWRIPAVKNILMLLYERFEQPFRSRDLVDAALLLADIEPDQAATLHQAVARLGLQPEYAELARLVDRAELGQLPVPPADAWARPRARARRVARCVGFFRRPVAGSARHLQRRLVAGKSQNSESLAWTAVQRVLPVAAAIRAGALGFGLPLDGPPPPVESAVLRSRGKLAWVDTPFARFLLTIGDDVTQAAVDELSGPVPVEIEVDDETPVEVAV